MSPALKLEKKYTYKDYEKWEDRFELIDGVAYAMAPAPIPKHQILVGRIYNELIENLDCKNCEVFIAPVDWKIDEQTVVQPDVSIFCEDIENKKYLTTIPKLVVEVLSVSTIFKDVNIKFKLYEKVGVKYYVIVNPENNEYKIFKLKNGEYKEKKEAKFKWDDCETKIDFKKVFK